MTEPHPDGAGVELAIDRALAASGVEAGAVNCLHRFDSIFNIECFFFQNSVFNSHSSIHTRTMIPRAHMHTTCLLSSNRGCSLYTES